MQPVNFPESNLTYGKPEGWKDEQCGELHVQKGVLQDGPNAGVPFILSKWEQELTDEQIAELTQTRKLSVFLRILSNGMPPVSLFM